MTLVLKDHNEQNVAVMNADYNTLQSYGVDNGFIIHCVDEDPNSIVRELENLDAVEKYVMSDADYDKLSSKLSSERQEIQEATRQEQPRALQEEESGR